MKKFPSLVLAVVLVVSSAIVCAPTASMAWGNESDGDPDIVYFTADGSQDLKVPGSRVTVDGSTGSLDPAYYINLTKETIVTPPNYIIAAYSVNGGKWKAARDALSPAKFPKLLDKELTLRISDRPIEKGQPPSDAHIYTFATIHGRARAPKLIANYLIDQDLPDSGKPGEVPGRGRWVLAESGATAAHPGVQLAAAAGKKVDSKGFGEFHKDGTTTKGIPVKEIQRVSHKSASRQYKVVKTTYFWRIAPRDGTYQAASKSKKVIVTSEERPTHYYRPTDSGVKTIRCIHHHSYIAGKTYVVIKGTYTNSLGKKETDRTGWLQTNTNAIEVLTVQPGDTCEVTLWTPATEKRAATVKQTVKFP